MCCTARLAETAAHKLAAKDLKMGEQLREVMNVVEHMHQREDAYRRKIKVSLKPGCASAPFVTALPSFCTCYTRQ